jgi:hypothetical protein
MDELPLSCVLAKNLIKKGTDVYLGHDTGTRIVDFYVGGVDPGIVVNIHEEKVGAPATMWIAMDAMEHAELCASEKTGDKSWILNPQ